MMRSRPAQHRPSVLFLLGVLLALLGCFACAFLTPTAPRQHATLGSSSRAAAVGRAAARNRRPGLFAVDGPTSAETGPAPAPAPAPAPEPKAEDAAAIGPAVGPQQPAAPAPEIDLSTLSPEEREAYEKKKKIEELKAKEVFETQETGNYECQVCGWQYQEEKGFGPFKPGTQFAALPQDFKCPNCKAAKGAFKPITVTIAGFSDNRQYGFGGNSLTSEQKGGLIFGGLFVFFLLFLSGYLLE